MKEYFNNIPNILVSKMNPSTNKNKSSLKICKSSFTSFTGVQKKSIFVNSWTIGTNSCTIPYTGDKKDLNPVQFHVNPVHSSVHRKKKLIMANQHVLEKHKLKQIRIRDNVALILANQHILEKHKLKRI